MHQCYVKINNNAFVPIFFMFYKANGFLLRHYPDWMSCRRKPAGKEVERIDDR